MACAQTSIMLWSAIYTCKPVCTSCVHLLKFIIPSAIAALVVSLSLKSNGGKLGRKGEEELTQVHCSQCCSDISGLIVSIHMLTSRVQSAPCKTKKSVGKEVSRVKWKTAIMKLHHVILALGKAATPW